MYCVNIKVLLLLELCIAYSFGDEVIIQLPDGLVKGRTETTATNTIFYSFTGIPYAQPPLGHLRFQAPLPVEPWDGIWDATYERNICYQVTLDTDSESEDCLIINVYTPVDPSSNASLPVMFFIYGGGYNSGSSERILYGPDYFMFYDVILVTFNYRLGPFGFLSTGDDLIPGNAGLKDQNMALQWVQKNIEYFGGDPEKVTIFGESAGASSVGYQILSPKSEGLFRAAIAESGSALCPWAYQRNQVGYTFKTAGYINSTFTSGNATSSDLLQFLTNVTAREIDEASATLVATETPEYLQIQQGFFYAPVIEHDHDGAFITEKMYESLKNGEFNAVPLITGINSEESLWWFDEKDSKNIAETFDNNISLLVPLDMNIEDIEIKEKAGTEVKEIYSPHANFTENILVMFKYFSDQSFMRPIIKLAELLSNFTDVFFYEFSFTGPLGCVSDESVDGFSDAVRHGEELYYLFARYCYRTGVYFNDTSKFPETDVLVHKRFIKMFTDFAKTLNPTPEKSELLENIIWPKVSDGDFPYLDIGSTSVVTNHPRNITYGKWEMIYEKYGEGRFDTY
ncbi:hypothetical protein NQ318_000444 [Aromia moschata]|uniref:Carboxylic ester hydrolase n=1 Tax=Aromia moschata TaxID=1265417 RepID=A0AAV8YU26_9CUCU|nr:hypothetical protein NQ318_000444 [Aromia moschata]